MQLGDLLAALKIIIN